MNVGGGAKNSHLTLTYYDLEIKYINTLTNLMDANPLFVFKVNKKWF